VRINNTLSQKDDRKSFALEFKALKSEIARYNEQEETATTGGDSSGSVSDQTELNMMITKDDLTMLQTRLLDLLEQDISALEIKQLLLDSDELNSLKEYVKPLEPRMLEVGQELIRKWGVKR